jgi:hypothetical protein
MDRRVLEADGADSAVLRNPAPRPRSRPKREPSQGSSWDWLFGSSAAPAPKRSSYAWSGTR